MEGALREGEVESGSLEGRREEENGSGGRVVVSHVNDYDGTD